MAARVLIVDDQELARVMLNDLLRADPRFETAGEASDGEEALRLYQQLQPDLVTMDIVMPGMDGIEAVRRIVELDPSARVVMVSSEGQEALVMESLVAGAAEFIHKPFDPQAALEVLDRVLKK